MTLAPDHPRRSLLAWRWLPAVLVVAPGAVERLGVAVEDESLRLPLVLLALGVAAWGGGRAAPRALAIVGLGALAAASAADLVRGGNVWAWVGTPLAFVALVVGFVAGGSRLRDDGVRAAFLEGLAIAAVAAAAWVLVDRLLGRPAATGPLGRAGIAGPTLAALLPIASRVTRARLAARNAVLRWAPTVLVVAALVATGSRTALAAGGIALLLAEGLSRTGRARVALVAAAGGAVVAGGALVALSLSESLPGGSWVGRTDTVRVRAGLASAAKDLVLERPWTGFGPHGFAAEALRVRDPEEARISDGRRPLLAHDDYLQVAVAGGLPVAALFTLAVALALVGAARAASRAEDGTRSSRAAVAGSLAATALAALAEDPFCASATAATFGLLAGGWTGADVEFRAGWAWVRRIAALVAFAAAGLAGATLAMSPASLLKTGAFRRDERGRAAAYGHGAALARAGDYEKAEAAYRRLLSFDPGATEARLDLSTLRRVVGRIEDAREVLLEAKRQDPTRYEVTLLLGHLLLGPEEPPSRRKPPDDVAGVLRAYNEASFLEGPPGRFETELAYARVRRRLGDLSAAAVHVARAKEVAKRRSPGLPAELVLESFRLGEVQKAPLMDLGAILGLALSAAPALSGEIEGEVAACLDAGEEEEAAAKAKVPETMKLDLRAANADFEAASVRLAALLAAGTADPAAWRGRAKASAAGGRHRRALAIYRALLADPFAKPDADLAFEAAASAARVDPGLQKEYSARGRTLLGFEALAKGDTEAALRDFRAALDKHPDGIAALYGLAKALARTGDPAAALVPLAKIVKVDPRVRERAALDPDLAPLLPRLP